MCTFICVCMCIVYVMFMCVCDTLYVVYVYMYEYVPLHAHVHTCTLFCRLYLQDSADAAIFCSRAVQEGYPDNQEHARCCHTAEIEGMVII